MAKLPNLDFQDEHSGVAVLLADSVNIRARLYALEHFVLRILSKLENKSVASLEKEFDAIQRKQIDRAWTDMVHRINSLEKSR